MPESAPPPPPPLPIKTFGMATPLSGGMAVKAEDLAYRPVSVLLRIMLSAVRVGTWQTEDFASDRRLRAQVGTSSRTAR